MRCFALSKFDAATKDRDHHQRRYLDLGGIDYMNPAGPKQMSLWKAKDGRIMRVIDVSFGRCATLEVMNATGTMRRVTTMDLSNFGKFLQPLQT